METERDKTLYSERLASLLTTLSQTLGVPIDSERLSQYVEHLSDLAEPQINFACREVCKTWKYPRFPLVGEIRDAAFHWTPPELARPPAIFRESKPAEWEQLGKNAGFSKAEIEEMLEAGRAKTRAHFAKLEADPEWRKLHARLGGIPGLTPKPSAEIPADPDERRSWAKRKAQEWRQ